jgi:hypothetical protein
MSTGNNRKNIPMKGERYEPIRSADTRSAGCAHGDCVGLLFYGRNEEIRGNGNASQRGSDHIETMFASFPLLGNSGKNPEGKEPS